MCLCTIKNVDIFSVRKSLILMGEGKVERGKGRLKDAETEDLLQGSQLREIQYILVLRYKANDLIQT